MSLAASFRILCVWLASALLVCVLAGGAVGQQLIVYAQEVQTSQTNDSIPIVITVDNITDTISGYTLYLQLGSAEFLGFWSDSVWRCDTTFSHCIDSTCIIYDGGQCVAWQCNAYADTTEDSCYYARTGAIDTINSLTSGWEFVDSRIIDGLNRVAKINAIANAQGGPVHPGIPPGSGTLCRILVGTKPRVDSLGHPLPSIPDSLCDSSILVDIVQAETKFSNPLGKVIGWTFKADTTCVTVPPNGSEVCVRACVRDSCLDSTCAYLYPANCYLWRCTNCREWDTTGYLDTTKTIYVDGGIQVKCCQGRCGDANNDALHKVNVADATFLINFVFVPGSPAPKPVYACGNANGGVDGKANVADATFIINFVFVPGSPAPSICRLRPGDTNSCCNY